MNRVMRIADDGAKLIHRLAKHIHHAPKRGAAHGNLNPFSEVEGFHSANHALDRLHRDGAHASFAEVLLHFGRHIERLRKAEAFAGDAACVVYRGKMASLKLNVHDRSDDLYDV